MYHVPKPIRHVFYRVLASRMQDKRERLPVLSAAIATALLLFMNALLMFMVANVVLERDLLPDQRNSGAKYSIAAILALFLIGILKSPWAADRHFAKLEQEFTTGSRQRKLTRTVLFWAYVALSATMPPALAIVWHAIHT